MLPAQKPVPTLPLPAVPTTPPTPSPTVDIIPKGLHRDAPQAHCGIVQPSPLRFDALNGAAPLEHGDDWETQITPVTPPSRPSSAPSLFSNIEPIDDPVDDYYWTIKEGVLTAQIQTQGKYERIYRSHIDDRLREGHDIEYFLYNHMSDEQKMQLHNGPWIWDGVEFANGKKEGKWVKDPKKWAKYVKKAKKEEKVLSRAIKL